VSMGGSCSMRPKSSVKMAAFRRPNRQTHIGFSTEPRLVTWRERSRACSSMQHHQRKMVLLCGPAGTGKSHAVLAVVNSLIRRAQNRAEETRQQAGESSTFVHREGDVAFRVVPILDCGELLRNFILTVAKGLATGFGDDLLALDEICQLKTGDDVFMFTNRQSLRVLFVRDQHQYVVENGNPELRNSMDKLLYNQRSLRVTSAGSDEVKALMKTSHRYIVWFQLSSRLTEVGSVTLDPQQEASDCIASVLLALVW
jgi:DNA polymerase III delta prime subunit